MSALLEVAVLGATGALGTELLDVLSERGFPVGRLHPLATDRSLGREVSLGGEDLPVETELASLDGLDLVFLCAPRDPSLEMAMRALRARVPAIDVSGALVEQPDVELLVADWLGPDAELDRPLVAGPGGLALALGLVLAPLERAAGLRRVLLTTLEAASVAGREGVDTLSAQSIGVFNQQGLAEDAVAFSIQPVPAAGDGGAGDPEAPSAHEAHLAATLQRLLGREDLALAVNALRVPVFGGDGASLVVETERPLSAADACAALEKAPGVALWPDAAGPATRLAVGRDRALVGRVRPAAGALQLWMAADGLRLAARNAVMLAEARPLRRRGS